MKNTISAIRYIVLAVFAIAFTVAISPDVVYASEAINVTIDGQHVTFTDQVPILVDGRVLAPVRSVFVQLGFEPDWDDMARQVTLTRAGYTIIITIDSAEFVTNGVTYELDVPALLIEGRTMVPLRAILESVGYNLDWEGETSTVQIATAEQELSPLVGTWDWLFMHITVEYYIFNPDGTGYMLFTGEMIAINWATEDGILSICITPGECSITCVAPSDWYYEIDGDTLVLTHTLLPDMEFTYVRA